MIKKSILFILLTCLAIVPTFSVVQLDAHRFEIWDKQEGYSYLYVGFDQPYVDDFYYNHLGFTMIPYINGADWSTISKGARVPMGTVVTFFSVPDNVKGKREFSVGISRSSTGYGMLDQSYDFEKDGYIMLPSMDEYWDDDYVAPENQTQYVFDANSRDQVSVQLSDPGLYYVSVVVLSSSLDPRFDIGSVGVETFVISVGEEMKEHAPSSWAKTSVVSLIQNDVFPRESYEAFQTNITRLEFAELAVRMYHRLGGTYASYYDYKDSVFTDSDDDYVKQAKYHGLVAGNSDGSFRPSSFITRAEIAALMCTLLERVDMTLLEPEGHAFNDVQDGHWAKHMILKAHRNGIVSGVGNGNFNPGGNATREQVMAMFHSILMTYDSYYYVD